MAELIPTLTEQTNIASTGNFTVESTGVEKADIFESLTPLAQTLVPLAKDAYQAKLGADLTGREGSVNEVGVGQEGTAQSENPNFDSLTNITEAFQQGLLDRTQAQLKVNQLVRQRSIDNPGFGSFFRRQAAKFFQDSLGGGGRSPFGGITQQEKDSSAVFKSIATDIARVTGQNIYDMRPEEAERAVLGHRIQLQNELEHKILQQRHEAENLSRTTMELRNFDSLRAAIARNTEYQKDSFNVVLKNTDITTEQGKQKLLGVINSFAAMNEQLLAGKIITSEQREQLRSFGSWTNSYKDLILNQDGLDLKERFLKERKVEAELRQLNNTGMTNEQMNAASNLVRAIQPMWDNLPLKAKEEALPTFIDIINAHQKLISGSLSRLKAADGTAGNLVGNLGALAIIKESLSTGDTSDLNRMGLSTEGVDLQNNFRASLQQLNGEGVVADNSNPVALATAHLRAIPNVRDLMDPKNAQTWPLIKKFGMNGLADRVQNELVTPLLSAGSQLTKTLGVTQVDDIPVPLASFLETSWSQENGVALAISQEGINTLSKEDLTKMESVVQTFNTKLSPQITEAARYRNQLMKLDPSADMNPKEWSMWAGEASKAMGIGENQSEIDRQGPEGEFTREVNDKLTRLQALEALGIGEELEKLKDLDTAANKTRKVVTVTRDSEGNLKSEEKNLSDRRLARIKAKEKREGNIDTEPFDQIKNPIAAIEYVTAAHPDLFERVPDKYLRVVAMKESSMNPEAVNVNSKATGLWQFMNSERVPTWNETVSRYGAKYGIKGDMRSNPVASTLMMGEFTRDQRGRLEATLGRDVSMGEMYLAHVLGAGGALKVLRHDDSTPISNVLSDLVIRWNPVYFRNQTVGSVRRKFDSFFK